MPLAQLWLPRHRQVYPEEAVVAVLLDRTALARSRKYGYRRPIYPYRNTKNSCGHTHLQRIGKSLALVEVV